MNQFCLPVYSMADWYDNLIPVRFLAPIDCLKLPGELLLPDWLNPENGALHRHVQGADVLLHLLLLHPPRQLPPLQHKTSYSSACMVLRE
jgi:hypothetical protein